MFEYLFIYFGINCKHQILNYFFTGLSMSIFPALVLIIPFSLSLSDAPAVILSKLLSASVVTTCFISYAFVKSKSILIFEIFDEINAYYTRYRQHRHVIITSIV